MIALLTAWRFVVSDRPFLALELSDSPSAPTPNPPSSYEVLDHLHTFKARPALPRDCSARLQDVGRENHSGGRGTSRCGQGRAAGGRAPVAGRALTRNLTLQPIKTMLQLLEPPTATAKRVSFDSEVCLPVIVEYRREQGFFEVTHVRFTDPLPCIQGRLAWMNLPGAVMRQLEDEAREAANRGVCVDELDGSLESFISLPVRVTYLADTLEFYSVVFVGIGGLIGRFLWEQLPEREEAALRVEVQQHASEE
jgi:hypothetical protein